MIFWAVTPSDLVDFFHQTTQCQIPDNRNLNIQTCKVYICVKLVYYNKNKQITTNGTQFQSLEMFSERSLTPAVQKV